jgi:hypothetical protein
VQRGEPVLGGRVDDLLPDDAGAAADARAVGVDLDAAQAVGAQEDRVASDAERDGVVARPLWRHAVPAAGGVVDHRDDVVHGLREDDGGGALLGREVPGAARAVPLGVAGGDDGAGDAGAQLGGAEVGGQREGGHRVSCVGMRRGR